MFIIKLVNRLNNGKIFNAKTQRRKDRKGAKEDSLPQMNADERRCTQIEICLCLICVYQVLSVVPFLTLRLSDFALNSSPATAL